MCYLVLALSYLHRRFPNGTAPSGSSPLVLISRRRLFFQVAEDVNQDVVSRFRSLVAVGSLVSLSEDY